MTTPAPANDSSASLVAYLSHFAGKRVLCVGDVMEDRFIYGEVRRISPEAPVPVLRITRESRDLGGAGNVVRNLAALGVQVSFVSIIGDDRAGREVSELLASLQSVEPYLRVTRYRETTIKNRFFSLDGHHLLRADRETVQTITPADEDDLARTALSQLPYVDVVVLSDYSKGVFAGTLASKIIAGAREAGKPVIVDPKGSDYARYTGATLITPNRNELQDATGAAVDVESNLVAAAQKLRADIAADSILVTRSGEGMSLVSADAVTHLSAETREVADVTGAGDTVVAVLAAALAAKVPLVDAARLSNVAAGVVVARHSTAVATTHDISAALMRHNLTPAEAKCADLPTAVSQLAVWRREGLKIGFTNGCFDLLHPGHIALINQARAACDKLVVGLNADASVRRLKGPTRPVQSESARATVLASLANVDLVVIFGEDTPKDLIEAIRPDVLIKGADYVRSNVVGGDFVESYGGKVLLAELVPSYSTTATIAALKTNSR
ncbi:MAG: D-glycero-beta-D-manno-heptose-7-phosphate kinase [Rhodospirillaceae bacterium]|nr:D-glycero-beta-D-manno-heptose-7-phosphate kinase [Rhodospirillaceae bacterium]